MVFPNPFPVFIPALLWLIFGPFYIRWLKARMFGQYIREDGPQSHHQKAGTPTMGGLLILVTVLATLLGFVALNPALLRPDLSWAVLTLVVFGALGFSDDYLKINKKKNKGLSGWSKLAVQLALGMLLGIWVMVYGGSAQITLFGLGSFDLGWVYPVFAALVVTGASNAYNLTDGLDGLAAGTGFLTFAGLAFLLVSRPELMLLSLILAGGCLGFLAFNRYPARIFMGDTGSLALGGVMGAMAVLGKIELYLLLLGAVYVVEALSVMLQVAYFKATRGRRLFKMSPLHHHFELSGWKEPTVVVTFALVQAVFSVLAVLLYNRV